MFGRLVPIGGGDPIPLLGEKLLVGRRSSCDIKLDFQNVSSHHCQLELREGYWFVRDLGSSNGTKVNGERVTDSVVLPGDELRIAKHSFEIEYEVSAGSEVPEREDTFSRSLMEKAGLETDRPSRRDRGESETVSRPRRQSRKVASEDDFIMNWLGDD
jgi:adenylate cyclase